MLKIYSRSEQSSGLKNDAECSLCKYVINYLNVLVASNASAQELEKALEIVCNILPAQTKSQCSSFVVQYGPVLVQLVAELDDPNVVCAWLGLCQKSSEASSQTVFKPVALAALPCNLCQYVVNYLDVIVQSNATETDFEKYLDQVCKIVPEKAIEAQCELLVQLYGKDIIKFLVEHADPKTVCQKIGICSK